VPPLVERSTLTPTALPVLSIGRAAMSHALCLASNATEASLAALNVPPP